MVGEDGGSEAIAWCTPTNRAFWKNLAGTVAMFDENSVRNLDQRSREADQAGFYKLKQGLDVDGKRSCTSRNIKDGDGKLLLDPTLTNKRGTG